jgi:MFS family permease
MGAGQSIIYTILPPLSRQLGFGPFQVTTIFAASAAIWIFSSAFWGVRSDRWGRKPVMLVGLVAFAL